MRSVILLIVALLVAVPSHAYETADSFQLPITGTWNPTQNFGVWNSDWNGYHLGEDVLRSSEVPVYAAANGRVRHAQPRTGYGNVVVIEHRMPNGSYVCSVNGHMRAAGLISENVDVTKGQLVGYLSDDSNENGGYDFVHIHFGIRQGTYVFWQYPGYGDSQEMTHWYDPLDFVNANHGESYTCQWISQSPNQQIWVKPGDRGTYSVRYRNTGTATWNNSGTVTDPNSVELWSCNEDGVIVNTWFVNPGDWINVQRITVCDEATVPPNGIATFTFDAIIPNVPSVYGRQVFFIPTHGGQRMLDNWGGMNFWVNVDADNPQAPPNLTVNPSDCSTTNSFFFDWGNSVDYGGSGLRQYRWKINNHMEHITASSSVQLDGSSGVHPDWNTFYVRAEDNVGNFSDYSTVQFCLLGDNNLSFENDGNNDDEPDGWTVSPHGDCTYTYMTNGGPDGQNYVRFSITGSNGWAHLIHAINGLIQPNRTYRLSFWYKTNADEAFSWRLFNASNSEWVDAIGCNIDAPTHDSQWHHFWGAPFSVTSSQLSAYPNFGCRIPPNSVGTFNIDGVVIEEVELCQ